MRAPLLTLAWAPILALGACGGGADQPASLTFSASTTGSAARSLQTPLEFGAAVVKAELLRGVDDSNPGVIFDAEADDVDVELIDLSESDMTIYSGAIPVEYLGTYTHARITIAAAGQRITYSDAGGDEQQQAYVEFYQEVDNSDGGYARLPTGIMQRGDVLVEEGGVLRWFQIDPMAMFSSDESRDALTAYQDQSPGDAVQLIELSESFSIESGGSYTLHANFDIADTFTYEDLDSDELFEPLGDDHDGTMNGIDFGMLVPGLEISAQNDAASGE